jgi:FkbM family methyltransferase
MKIFLDVGAYKGDTARAVLNHGYNFDRIYCFEPNPNFAKSIRELNNPKIEVREFGLWKDNVVKKLFSSNKPSASIFNDRFTEDVEKMDIKLIKASDWFKENIKKEDEVFLKLNCEGAECDIIEDIIDAGEGNKVKALMIDYDVRKIDSQKHREAETRDKIKRSDIAVVISVEKEDRFRFVKKHAEWTHYWIDKALGLIKDKKKNG